MRSCFRAALTAQIYACHGVAGIVGLVFTGVFAQASVTANDGFTVIPGGWLDQNYRQVGIQLAYICAVWGYVFVVSYLLMFLIDHVPVRVYSAARLPLTTAGLPLPPFRGGRDHRRR